MKKMDHLNIQFEEQKWETSGNKGKYSKKTKGQLLHEFEDLHQKIAQLEKLKGIKEK